jgi:hypothetical protein
MSDLLSFADLVRTMRAAQAKYFKSHTQMDLQRAKFLERQVDTQLEKIPKPEPKPEQLPLTTE